MWHVKLTVHATKLTCQLRVNACQRKHVPTCKTARAQEIESCNHNDKQHDIMWKTIADSA